MTITGLHRGSDRRVRLRGAALALALSAAAGSFAAQAAPGPAGAGERAEGGDPQAQLELGYAYALGEDVVQDFVEAHKWLNLAAAAGEPRAAEARDRLAERMTPDQIARAQQLAREWTPDRPPPEQAAETRAGPQTDTRAPSAEPEVRSRATVARIQRGLAFVGYAPGPIDGLVGGKTRAALRAFQTDRGLPADGRVTADVLEELRAAASAGFRAPARPPSPPADARQALQGMVGELLSLTAEAEERRSADPGFVEDLRALARRYEDALLRGNAR
ncbi:MAG: peptidoglycan-binding protein [Chromatiales bacterium]